MNPNIAASRTRQPAGVRWSTVWRTRDGDLVEGDHEVPIDEHWRITGQLWLCPADDCATAEWLFDDPAEPPCCRRHPVHLVQVPADPRERNPVGSAHTRLRARVRQAWERRRQQAIDAAAARARAAQTELAKLTRRTAADLRGHVPSLIATGTAGVVDAVLSADPVLAEAVGVVMMTCGMVLAYIATYVVERMRAQRSEKSEGELVGRIARRVRSRARQVACAVLAAGAWAVLTALLGIDPATISGDAALLTGGVLAWAANRRHWENLAAARRRLRELARQKAEAAAARAQDDLNRVTQPAPQEPVAATAQEGPVEMGRRMAARWAQIAQSDTVPTGFLMRRTWIVPEETRELTVPDGEAVVRIGWEYAIESEPGVLVARVGGTSPLLAARDWLASMLGIHPSLVSVVDRPDGQVNRGLLSVTDRLSLGNTVHWKGPERGLRREGGTILGHVGADLSGNDVYEYIHVPGQLTGGMTVGHSGGGKSAGARVSLLNDLAAGIFPVLYDPVKSLGDFSEFVGIFPMGCTPEHQEVILRSLHAERNRRSKAINGRKIRDRYGRTRPEPGAFKVGRDGPQIRSYWDEFHRNAANKVFLNSFLDLLRVQRAVAMDSEVYTQGGGLQDLGDSVVRGLLNQARLRLYRMPDNLARLAGYTGDYLPSQLPRVPGACLVVAEGVPVIPLRGAWVTREDEDNSVYDYLYAPDGALLLPAPKLPTATLEVFRREGLLDLWNLGKGPDGLDKLIDGGGNLLPPPNGALPTTQTAPSDMGAAEIILAIVATEPGCPRATLDNHPVWKTAPGWGAAPVPSTISRAARTLITDGLMSRDNNQYRVTEAGQPRAQAAVNALFGTPAPATAGREDMIGGFVLSALLNPDGAMSPDQVLAVMAERGWAPSTDRPTIVGKLEELRDRGWVARTGDRYELASTAIEHLTAQAEEDREDEEEESDAA